MKNLSIIIFSLIFITACNNSTNKGVNEVDSHQKDSLEVVMNLKRKVKPEYVSAFKTSFEKCKQGTLSEPGIIEYAMYQSYLDSTEFFIFEVWKNKPEHLKHMQTNHLKIHLTEIENMMDPSFEASNRSTYVCPVVNQ